VTPGFHVPFLILANSLGEIQQNKIFFFLNRVSLCLPSAGINYRHALPHLATKQTSLEVYLAPGFVPGARN
jgi:hypothetical protein